MVGKHCLGRASRIQHIAKKCFRQLSTGVAVEGCWKSRELRIPTPYGPLAALEWSTQETAVGNPERNVLMLHGYMDNAASFDPIIPHLDPRSRVVALDFTGHGLSSHLPPGSVYSTYQFPIDVRRAVEHLGWKKYALVGHSLGGLMAHHYASLFPAEVLKLAILDGFCPMYVAPSRVAKTIQSALLEQLRLEAKDAAEMSSYTKDEVLKLYAEASLVPYKPDDVMCLMKRGCRRTEDGRYVLTRDVRLKAVFWHRTEQQVLYVSAQRYRNEMLVVSALPGLGYSPIHFKKLADVCKASCSKFKMIVMEGNHHVHMNEAGEVATHLRWLLDGS